MPLYSLVFPRTHVVTVAAGRRRRFGLRAGGGRFRWTASPYVRGAAGALGGCDRFFAIAVRRGRPGTAAVPVNRADIDHGRHALLPGQRHRLQ